MNELRLLRALASRLIAAREKPSGLDAKAESGLILEIAPHLDDFLAELFGIQAEFRALSARHHELAPLHTVKRQFVQRRAANKVKPEEAAKLDGAALEAQLTRLLGGAFDELGYARKVSGWLAEEAAHASELERTGHMSPLERPERVATAIAQLVSDTAGAAEVAAVS